MISVIVTIICMAFTALCSFFLFEAYIKEVEENGSKTRLSEVLAATSLILVVVVLLQFMYVFYWLISVGAFK